MSKDKNSKFNYGNFLIEYRMVSEGDLRFLKKNVKDVDTALKEADKLKNAGYHDVRIIKN